MTISTSSVLLLLGPEYQELDDISLTEYIATAELVVSEDLADSGLSAARQTMIGKYLAAHFAVVAVERGGLTRSKVGESTDTFKEGSKSDRGFNLTRFGQQAVALDSSGILALNANAMTKAEFRVV